MMTSVTGFYTFDSFYNIHTLNYLAEYRIAPALHILAAVIKKTIISYVDKELR